MNPTDSTGLRIRGPADLTAAIPYLLGFVPRDSLVLVGMSEHRLVVTARLDLDLAGELLADTAAAIARGGATAAVCVLYSDQELDGAAWIAHAVQSTVTGQGLEMADILLVTDGEYRSLQCPDPGCCPQHGRPVPDPECSVVAASAVAAGMVALPSREALAATLQPAVDAIALAVLEDAAAELASAPEPDRWLAAVKRRLFAATRNPARLPADEVARFGVALGHHPVRDPVWMAVDARRIDARELLHQLATRLPGQYQAAPLFLYGWAAWREGNGALANIAAQQALDRDPGYSAADLLLAALARGVDPAGSPGCDCPPPTEGGAVDRLIARCRHTAGTELHRTCSPWPTGPGLSSCPKETRPCPARPCNTSTPTP